MRFSKFIVLGIALALLTESVQGSVTRYINKPAWLAAVSEVTTITFTGLPEFTVVTTQYSDLGIVFTDGNDAVEFHPINLNDGAGLASNEIVYGLIVMEFAQPVFSIAAEFNSIMDVHLYSGDQLIYLSSPFDTIQGHFGGLISTESFDRAVLRNPATGFIMIDDLHFGSPIPAPGALGLLGIAVLIRRRHRM